MMRWAIASLFTVLLLLGLAFRSAALVQTAPPPTGSPAPGSTPTGAFSALSPGNQRIALALFNAQRTDGSVTTGTTSTATPLTLDQIAAKKQSGEGWGRVFQDMKAQGLVQAKNLGQVVSRSHRASGGPIVTASGHRFDDGSRHEGVRHERDDDQSEHAGLGGGRSSHHDDDQVRGGQGVAGSRVSSGSDGSARGQVSGSQGAGRSVWYEHGDYGASRGQTYAGGSGRSQGVSGSAGRGGK